MGKIQRWLSVLATLLLVITITQPASADAWFTSEAGSPDGSMVVAINEVDEYGGLSSRLMYNMAERREYAYCPDGVQPTGDCSIVSSDTHFIAEQIIPPCASDSQENCIEGLKFANGKSDLVSAKFVRSTLGPTYTFEDLSKGLFAGSTVSVWELPGLENAGGTNLYSVNVKTENRWSPSEGIYRTYAISASINPVKEKFGDYRVSNLRQVLDGQGRTAIGGWAMTPGCAYTEAGICGAIQNFNMDSKFELSVRVSNQITGWFRGRIQEPNVKIEKFSERNNRITLSASPVNVARLSTLIYKDTTSPEKVALLRDSMRTGQEEYFKGNTIRSVNPDWHGLEWVEAFREDAKDTAAGTSTLWNFRTMTPQGPCFEDNTRVVGMVTTNATAMSSSTPLFWDGSLTYKVAGLHYAPDGKTLNEGSYDLVMRSDVARCLYHFTSAPLSATVSVIGDGGENKIATTVVSEKDGWLKIRAYGFSFSSPTISVKLTQASSKKVTITCVKGKLTKKVTAVGPKCPAGYKKK